MNSFAPQLESMIAGSDLSVRQSEALLGHLTDGDYDNSQIAAILTALRFNKEKPDEIAGFVRGMRQRMQTLNVRGPVVDTCGTGGDHSGTFNISTTVALVLAGAGVKVAKHGNRSASSKCGSADVLEALGVKIDLTPRAAERVLDRAGIVFLFAPRYHPAMKNVGPVRKALGIRTIFNVLGPFANPAKVKRQLIGVPTPEDAKQLAEVAKKLGYIHAFIVSSEDGLDEVSTVGRTKVYEVKHKSVRAFTIRPQELGFRRASLRELRGGSAKRSAQIIRSVLSGTAGPKRDIVLLNAGMALVAAGKADDIRAGIALAEESIDGGQAQSALNALVSESGRA